MSDCHGRDSVSDASLALDKDGKFIGLRVDTNYCQGAYLTASAGVPAGMGSMALTNVYDIQAAHISFRAVYTNTTPVGPYRGAGKPEAIYVMERLVDKAAAEMNIDPDRNPPEELHPPRRDSLQDAARAGARQRQLRGGDGHGGRGRRLEGLRRPQGRIEEARQAARPRRRLFHGNLRPVQRPHGNPLRRERQRHRRLRHPQPRPGSRDGLCADGLGMARRRFPRCA